MRFISRGIWKVRMRPSPKVRCIPIPSMRRPLKKMRPLVGGMAPDTKLNRVVLPAPLGPMIPVIAPGKIWRVQWLTARTPPKSFTRSWTSRMGVFVVKVAPLYFRVINGVGTIGRVPGTGP